MMFHRSRLFPAGSVCGRSCAAGVVRREPAGSVFPVFVLAAVVLTGCGPLLTVSAGSGSGDSSATVQVEGQDPVSGRVAAGFTPVRVRSAGGMLTDVRVTAPDGTVVPGAVVGAGDVWESDPGVEFPFDTAYRVSATAVDSEGDVTRAEETFATAAPSETPSPSIKYVSDGSVVGVGMPIVVNLGTSVDEADRRRVEERLSISASRPVEGAWSWSGDGQTVTFRPKTFWPADTHVVLYGKLYGVKLNSDAAAGANIGLDYHVGDSFVMEVDQPSLMMTVKRNGQVEKTIPVTIGKPGYETLEGVKVISAKEGTITMKSPAGDPEYYVADNVEYSMRLTDHGEYIHAAPWAASAFGNYRYSHGCISMSTANAAALFAEAHPGDVVWVNGQTGQPWRKDNGISVWNETWDEWLAGSATGARTVTVQG